LEVEMASSRGVMARATIGYDRLKGLKALARQLAKELDANDDPKLVAALARQYRETMAEIDAIEGGKDDDDAVAAIIIRNRQSATD